MNVATPSLNEMINKQILLFSISKHNINFKMLITEGIITTMRCESI